jgi:2-dehydropantoate 2-reductase
MAPGGGSAPEILRAAGFEVRHGTSELEVLWEKAARLAVLAAATAISQRPVGELRADPDWRPRLEAAVEEACAAAAADGVPLAPARQWAIIDAMPARLTTSTARDVAAGRPSELDAITGAVVRAARRAGVAAPELEQLWEEACRPRSR